MSDINSQIKIHMVDPIKDQSIGTKTSLEKLNNILQELHKNIMKENSSNNIIKSSNKEDKNKTEEENINQNDDQSDFINEIKSNKEEIDDQDKERTTGDNVGDINDRISNNHINRLKISEEYKNSSDINLINKRSIDFNNKLISNTQKETNEIKEEEENIEQYSFKEISEITLSSIGQNNLNSFNMTQGSELYLTTIIEKLVP